MSQGRQQPPGRWGPPSRGGEQVPPGADVQPTQPTQPTQAAQPGPDDPARDAGEPTQPMVPVQPGPPVPQPQPTPPLWPGPPAPGPATPTAGSPFTTPFEPAADASDHRRRSLERLVDIPPPVAVPPPRPYPPPKRVRVVLAERKRARRVVRTLAEVEEQTGVGEMLVRQLIRAQLATSAWLAVLVVLAVGTLPVLFWYLPDVAELTVFGLQLPWLVLGLAVYPFLLGVGWLYVRLADRQEQNFVSMVED